MITKYAYLLKTITTHIAMNNTNATSTITNSHHNHKHMIATTIILFRNTTYNRCSSLFTKAQFSTLCCIIGLLFNAAIYAQETPNFPLPVDEKQFESRELVYRMSQEGDSLGYSKVSIEVKRDQIVVSEVAEVKSSFSMVENMTTSIDKKQLSLIQVNVSGDMNGKGFTCETKNEGGTLSGTSDYSLLYSKNESTIDSLIDQPFIERLVSLFLIPPAIDFSESNQFNYQQYNANNCGFKEITVIKTGDFTIEGPSGKYDTYKLEFSGGMAQQRLYISKGKHRKIVRIEFANNNWVYDLL
jgi:hypothetical protein